MKIGEVYFNGGYHVMIVGKDPDTPIWFIAIAIMKDIKAQCPFVPVHEDVLMAFTDSLFPESTAEPADISSSIEFWLEKNKGNKNAFASPIREIWENLIQTLKSWDKKPKDFFNGEWYHLPIFFPITTDDVDPNAEYGG